jgi:hypothetical protein
MPGITTEFLFEIALEVPVLALGETPYGERRVARIEGGSFEGTAAVERHCVARRRRLDAPSA